MVLSDLGSKLTKALHNMSRQTVIDKEVVNQLLKEIGNALISADVDVKLVLNMRKNIMNNINLDQINKRREIETAVFNELVKLLDPGVKPFTPKKGKSNVIMFVGLQGAGKTTTVTKMATYYKKKGFTVSLVCADTFRAGAYDQLKQNALRAKVPYYGSYHESDPVQVAVDGVNKFKEEGVDIIIIDTSGRHKQESALFEEMKQVASAVKPDQVVFVMDGTIGQAAHDQAQAFKQSIDVGACIITKLDGNAKGGGALSAVAATKSPIIFYGVGEHIEDFEVFEPVKFVRKLLDMGDLEGLAKVVQNAVPKESQELLMERISQGLFSLRDMYEQFQTVLKMGPIGNLMEMLPGMGELLKQAKSKGIDSNQKLQSYICIMDSMTKQEMDDPELLAKKSKTRESRIKRIARGSGRSTKDVNELLVQYTMLETNIKKMKGKIGKKGQMNTNSISQLQKMMNPQMMKQMGGFGGISQMMKQMGGMFGGNNK
eukprot:TRINITY_DN4465_c1_g1_i1.p1 TRINITY_DN4465_c1_g1~~TRINITY_DN4465_c1_g1_i1.p1  ORF type:complete len:486 (+),score=172.71 TRINITY_DN4465_c1_g1_i1:52-1509(+)